MTEQDLFYPPPPTWTSRWCTGIQRSGYRLTAPHWAETALGGDVRKWRVNQCPSCLMVRRNAVRHEDKPKRNARARAAWHRNADSNRAKLRARKAAKPEVYRAISKRYRETHPAMMRANDAERRAREGKSRCEHGRFCFELAANDMLQTCFYCGSTDNIQADHWMPLVLGGLNCRENLQPLCRYHNASKSGRHPLDYERSIGFVRD